MAVITSRSSKITENAPASIRTALAVADANWFTTENLFNEVERDDVATLLLSCIDYRNAWNRGLPPWSWGKRLSAPRAGQWRREHVLPSGWMKSLPRVGMRPIARTIRDWWRDQVPDSRRALVMTYPHYLYLRDMVRPDRSIYFNLDDYRLYWPKAAAAVAALERSAVRESDVTVCVSRLRAEELRASVPEAAARIHHLPHGAPRWSLSAEPFHRPAEAPEDLALLPRPLLGYVGSIEGRVDWALLTRLSEAFPRASVVLVGRPPHRSKRRASWMKEWERFRARPNVHAIGWRPQEEIAKYNRAFDVCLIPYLVDHPFNQACSPTKIMDCMGTGRPVVSTGIPECRLYEDLFHIADAQGFIEAVRSVLDQGSDDGRAALRHERARANTCAATANRLLDLIPS